MTGFASLWHVAKTNTREDYGIKEFGKKLRQFRLEKGMTIEELANTLDLHTSQVGRIERGEINTSISFVFVFARILKVKPSDFFDFDFDGGTNG